MITRKVGPGARGRLHHGLKPAAQTPFSAFALAVLAERAGVPKGVFRSSPAMPKPIGGEF